MDTNFVVGAAVSAAKIFRSAREDTRRYTKRDPVVGAVNLRSPDRSAFRFYFGAAGDQPLLQRFL
jgi:hypothetical protein